MPQLGRNLSPLTFLSGKQILQCIHLFGHGIQHRCQYGDLCTAFFTTSKSNAGDRGQPFLKLAIETVLPVPGKHFEQTNNQRSGQTQQRRPERHAHALQLRLEPRHQAIEDGQPFFAFLRVQAADGVDNGWNGCRQTEECTQQTQIDQNVGDITRDFPLFFDTFGHGIQNGPGRGRADLRARASLPQQRSQRRQQLRCARIFANDATDKGLDPAHGPDQLRHLIKTSEDADKKDHQDETVQIRIGIENRQHIGQRQKHAQPGQADRHQHQQNLSNGMREMGSRALMCLRHARGSRYLPALRRI